jgi:hypothetical protein
MPQKFPKKILANLIEMLSDQFKNHLLFIHIPNWAHAGITYKGLLVHKKIDKKTKKKTFCI